MDPDRSLTTGSLTLCHIGQFAVRCNPGLVCLRRHAVSSPFWLLSPSRRLGKAIEAKIHASAFSLQNPHTGRHYNNPAGVVLVQCNYASMRRKHRTLHTTPADLALNHTHCGFSAFPFLRSISVTASCWWCRSTPWCAAHPSMQHPAARRTMASSETTGSIKHFGCQCKLLPRPARAALHGTVPLDDGTTACLNELVIKTCMTSTTGATETHYFDISRAQNDFGSSSSFSY